MRAVIATTCGSTWPRIHRELDRIHLGTFTGPTGTFRQRTGLTKVQRDILAPAAARPTAADLPAHTGRRLTSANTQR